MPRDDVFEHGPDPDNPGWRHWNLRDNTLFNGVQSLFAEVVRAYARLHESDKDIGAFPRQHDISATEVAIAATGLLEAADMAAFELGMWQTLKN